METKFKDEIQKIQTLLVKIENQVSTEYESIS